MQLRKTSVSDELPIKLAAAKKAMRVDHGFNDDVVERKIRAAVELIEERTGRILRPTTFEASLTEWPCDGEIRLQVHPIREVEGVTYVGQGGGAPVPVPGDAFSWRELEAGAEVFFFTSWNYPSLWADSRAPIVVTFEAGYDEPEDAPGDDPEFRLPSRVEELILLLAGHWYKNPEAVMAGNLAEVPLSAELLFKELRIFR